MGKYRKILLFICLLDLLITVWLLELGIMDGGRENFTLRWALRQWGSAGLILVKLSINLLSILPLEIAFYYKLLDLRIFQSFYRLLIWVYIAGYALFVVLVNFL